MSEVETLDAAWRAANPLPALGAASNKNSRGRVLAVGGSRRVPGAIRLTAEGALRAGAGKARIATIASAALALGIAMPEAAVIGLAETEDGEIAAESLDSLFTEIERSDAVVVGPGLWRPDAARALVRAIGGAARPEVTLLLDAIAASCAGPLADALAGYAERLVLTPNASEMAYLIDRPAEDVCAHLAGAAAEAARRFRAVVALREAETVIADPDGRLLRFTGGNVGLATGGSGDLLAGLIGGLVSTGADPFTAAAWGVWMHGEAGQVLARTSGPVGFLARELLAVVPHLRPA